MIIERKETDRFLDFRFVERYSHINPHEFMEILKNEDWPRRLHGILEEFFWRYDGKEKKSKEWHAKRKEIVKVFEELLRANMIALGKEGKNLDFERKPVDTVIIHHTSTRHNEKLSYIDALCLIRLYARKYAKGEGAIWSNHFKEGRQTFIPYHYIIRRDGTFERMLDDSMIGWHSGDWDVNCRSIAVCFLDDLEDKRPTKEALQAAVQIIRKYNAKNVLGHCEVVDGRTCPGGLFLGENGWKKELLTSVHTSL